MPNFKHTDTSILTNLSLFCTSGHLLTVLQFISSSFCSAGLLSINFFCHSTLLQLFMLFFSVFHLTLHICSISSCASSHIPFLAVSFFSHTEQLTLHSLSHFIFIHTFTTVQLPNSLGKRKTTIWATKTPTETLTDLQWWVHFANRFQTKELTVREISNPSINTWSDGSDHSAILHIAILTPLMFNVLVTCKFQSTKFRYRTFMH